jgi:hypothetical protein
MATFAQRMIGAARLDAAIYEEVEADRSATWPALAVVVLASVAAGIGTGASLAGVAIFTAGSLIGWYVWAFLTYWIGTRLLSEPQTSSSHGELLRVIGFAASPGILRVLGVVPGLWRPLFVITAIWTLVAGVVAVRQALDYTSPWRAVGVVAIGWALQWLVLALLRVLIDA